MTETEKPYEILQALPRGSGNEIPEIDFMPEAFLELFTPLIKNEDLYGVVGLLRTKYNWAEVLHNQEVRKTLLKSILQIDNDVKRIKNTFNKLNSDQVNRIDRLEAISSILNKFIESKKFLVDSEAQA